MEKLSNEQYLNFFKSKGYEVLSTPYNSKEKVVCVDKEGYKYSSSYDGIRDKRTKELSRFKKNNPFKPYNMRLYVSKVEPNSSILMKDKELFDTKGKLIVFKCPACGKSFEKRWEHYISQELKVCPQCGHKNGAKKQKISFELIKKLFEESELTLLSTQKDYKNRETRLSCMDKEEFKFAVKYDSIKSKSFDCIERYKINNPFALENLNHYIEMNQLNCKAIKRIDSRTWKFKCKCGQNFAINLSNFLIGYTRCPDCVKQDSKYSLAVKEWLEKHSIHYIKEYRFEDCRNIKPLPFDFAINKSDKWILIEVDGQQHFYTTPWTNEEDLHNQQLRDKIKNNYCKDHNHILIRIPYWKVNSGSYEEILTQTLLA